MRKVFKHRLSSRDEVRAQTDIIESQRLDTDLKHDKLKDSALINYYMMGGY